MILLRDMKKIEAIRKNSITKNFSYLEFACKDGTKVPEKLKANCIKLATNLQVLRDYLNAPITINSGYRTRAYNKKINGRSKSYHLKCLAADIQSKGITPLEVRTAILFLIKKGKMEIGGLKNYETFVHYDVRGFFAEW